MTSNLQIPIILVCVYFNLIQFEFRACSPYYSNKYRIYSDHASTRTTTISIKIVKGNVTLGYYEPGLFLSDKFFIAILIPIRDHDRERDPFLTCWIGTDRNWNWYRR